jgi:Flp pilus assembly protein TadG
MASLISIRRRIRQERGAELIEMALVLPLLMLVIMGIIDFGFLFREMSVVTNAAREGARAGVLPDYSADANVSNRVQQYLNASGISVTCPSADCVVASPTISVPAPTGTFNARDVRVTIFHQFSFLGPIAALFGGSYSSVALTGRAVMRVE